MRKAKGLRKRSRNPFIFLSGRKDLNLRPLGPEAAALERQWKLRVERVRYEASRAQRQYEACEPENRLVARSLEHLWEEKLRAVEQVEKEFEAWRKQHHAVLTDKDRQQILALGENLPKLWSAPSTTNADRKQISPPLFFGLLFTQELPEQPEERLLFFTSESFHHLVGEINDFRRSLFNKARALVG